MKTRPAVVAQRLLNLYRNAFAVDGGWKTVNRAFVDEASDSVLSELVKLPCGGLLARHISKLKSGGTKMDSIDAEFLPYNGMLAQVQEAEFDESDFAELRAALENFQPNHEHLEGIKNLPVVRQFGNRWPAGVRAILKNDSLIAIWRTVLQTDSALRLWGRAAEILSSSPSDLLRAEVQADMPEYETYLPMFGKEGIETLARLRTLIVSS